MASKKPGKTASPDNKKIGRLSAFGVEQIWQAAMLLPRDWDDFADLRTTFPAGETDMPEGSSVFVAAMGSQPERKKGNVPRTTFMLRDANGATGMATIWGDARPITAGMAPGKRAAWVGKFGVFNGRSQFDIEERLDPRWLKIARPKYPGKPNVIGAETVRARIIGLLPEAIPQAAAVILDRLAEFGDEQAILEMAGGSRYPDIETLLWQAHLPDSIQDGLDASAVIEKMAAVEMLAQAQRDTVQKEVAPLELSHEAVSRRANALPFPMTDEQMLATDEILEDLRRPVAMKRMLTGDVGTGKTAVYGTAVAVAADAVARIAILMPNTNLADQVYKEMTSWWPDVDIHLVSAGEKKGKYEDAQVVIGTTALLSSGVGHRDLMVVDEQQKFSREQREQLASHHLLEVSATCIPRTQALVSFGVADLSRLKKGHVEKTIHTKVHQKDANKKLFRDCIQTVHDGHQLAIVYPSRDETEAQKNQNDSGTIKSATQAFDAWEARFPGRVRLLHGQMKDDEKKAVIDDMKADRADVLVTTTVIEVGLTLPRLRRVMVVDAERHGLTGLHQIRGRLARHGGEGWFDLYLSRPVSDAVNERLSCLEKTTDGFELADMDLKLRGHGDLNGEAQSGAAISGLLLGRAVGYERMAQVAESLVGVREKPEPIDWVDSLAKMDANTGAVAPSGNGKETSAKPAKPKADNDEMDEQAALERAMTSRRSMPANAAQPQLALGGF